MKKRSYCFICVLFVTLAVVVTVCLLPSKSPLGFIPDSANIIRLPKRGWVVYVFPADFNSIMPEAALELASLGFIEGGPGFIDPCETRWFTKTYTDGRKHYIEIYNKKLGSVGKLAMEEGWVSVSSHDDLFFELRKKQFIRGIKRLISRIRDK